MKKPDQEGTESERFWKRVKILDNGCWQWTGGQNGGYGQFTRSASRGLKWPGIKAHIWSYETYVGPVAKGLELDHLCRNTLCVNPLHLEPVTKRVNILRGTHPPAQNARKQFCKRGHPFSGDNLALTIRDGKIGRRCRECVRILRGHIRRYSKRLFLPPNQPQQGTK